MEQPVSSKSRRFLSHPVLRFSIGLLVFLFSLVWVYSWLQVFLLTAIEIPANGIGLSNLCDWQYSLSSELVWSGNTEVPFIVLLIVTAGLFAWRLAREHQPSHLLLEFGILNLLFVSVGTLVFILAALANVVVLMIPGNETRLALLLDCKPIFPVLPGLLTTRLMTAGLIYSQATGWLMQRISSGHGNQSETSIHSE